MTKNIFAYGAIALSAVGIVAASPPGTMSAKDEQRFTRELAGRTAGPARTCVRQGDLRSSRTYGGDAIVFDGPGSLIYVNKLRQNCPSLDFGRAIKTDTYSTNLCSGDIATAFDPVSGIEYAGCPLGEFVPYRRGG